MGRPRLYHTSEQQRAANNAKSYRHYQRNKSELQRRRRSKYRQTASNRLGVIRVNESASTPTSENSELLPEQRHLAYWRERVAQLSLEFSTLVDAHATKYVDALFSAYRASSSNKEISDAVLTLSTLQTSIQRYEHEILQLAGVGSEWSEAHQLSNRVCEVTRWTEEVLCLATVDPEGLIASHATKQLMFQVVETSP